jgi:hypothetical protein
VAPPANLVLEVTLKPAALGHAVVAKALGLPTLDSATMTSALFGAEVGPIIDMDQSAFAAATLGSDFRPRAAFAVALVAFEIAKERLERTHDVVKKADGAYSLHPRQLTAAGQPEPDGAGHAPKSFTACELQPAAARDSWALVCSADTGTVEALGPYLARTMANATSSAAMKVIVHPNPLRATGWLARAVLEGITQGGRDFAPYEQFVNDVDHIEATVDTWTQPRVVIMTHYRTATSVLSQTALDESGLGTPPEAFADLPSDTRAAGYTRARVATELVALFGAADHKANFGLSTRDHNAVTRLLDATFAGKSTTVALLPSGNAIGAVAVVVEGDAKKIVAAWKAAVPGLNVMANARPVLRRSGADTKALPLVRFEKPGPGAKPGSIHIVLSEDQNRWSTLGPTPEDDVVPGAGAAPKLNLKDLAHLYVAPDMPMRDQVTIVVNDTAPGAHDALARLRAGGVKIASVVGVDALLKERSGSGGFSRLDPGAPPFTFLTKADAAHKTHRVQIDLPPEQLTGSLRDFVKTAVRYTMGVFRKVVIR